LEHFNVKFGYPSYIVFRYRVKKRQTHRQTEVSILPQRLPSAWVNILICIHRLVNYKHPI